MQSYVGFVIFIFVIGLIVYLVVSSGGVSDFFDFKLNIPFGLPSTPTSSQVKIGGESANVVIRQPETPFEKPKPTPPPGFTVEELSPYYRQVRISGVNRAFSVGSWSSIALSAANLEQPVNITGWSIDSNRGTVLTIQGGLNDYNPVSSPAEGDIVLNTGDYVNIYDTVTSFGFDLRLNKCTGYLNNVYVFQPELPRNCPSFDRSEITPFSGRCQSFILSLGSCRQPTTGELNSFSTESACQAFLGNINYGSCYRQHRADTDFLSREWRLSLGRDFNASILDTQHDRVLLFDRSGLLVDQYIY